MVLTAGCRVPYTVRGHLIPGAARNNPTTEPVEAAVGVRGRTPRQRETIDERQFHHRAGDLQRRGFLKCMTWAGTAMVWTVAGGVPRSRLIGSAEAAANDGFTFVQISDSHLGFDKPANPNVTATLQDALNGVAAMPQKPAFMIHTGDITHLSKPAQFDTAAQLIGGTKLTLHTVPGEHDILEENGKSYLNRFGKGTKGDGWYSFDADGVHFIGLVNVVNLQGNGLGSARVTNSSSGWRTT